MTHFDRLLLSTRSIPGLAVGLVSTHFADPLGQTEAPHEVVDMLRLDAVAPMQREEEVRSAVRDLLRRDGYKPTGRGKPASEYLVKAAEGGFLGPINAAVDACNAVSLHSGLPISVIDTHRAATPLEIGIGGPDDAYVFNASGQEIRLRGLLAVRDTEGFCATPVRDSHRTKTHDATLRTVSVVWAPDSLSDRLARAVDWYAALLRTTGATVDTQQSA